MLAIMVVGIQSCSDDLHDVGDVEVNFTAMLPTDTRTRSFGKAEQVNTLVVGIFKKGFSDEHTNSGGSWSYYEIDRKFFPISGTSIDVSLSLAQNQTYSFVFWAYDSSQNIYDIDDLTAIKMNTLPNPITFSEAEASDAQLVIAGGDSAGLIAAVQAAAEGMDPPVGSNQCGNYGNTDAGIIYSKVSS